MGLMLFFMSFSLFAQDGWYRDYDFEAELEYWDVYLEVWVLEDGGLTVNFEDVWSENWFDIREQMAGLMFVLSYMIDDGESISEYIDYIIYSWFEYNNPSDPDSRYMNEDLRWDMHMTSQWLDQYSYARRSTDKRHMLDQIIETQQAQWEEVNNLFLKPTIDPREQEFIDEQRALEEEYLNSPDFRGPPPKR